MLSLFKPTYMVESVYNIEPSEFIKRGKKVVFADLDNTLIAWNHPKATQELINWLDRLNDFGIQVIVLSNNNKDRVEKAVAHTGVTHIPSAFKPCKKGFEKAFSLVNQPKENIIMVGDQVITDIVGANRFKIDSVLVKPILASDAWNTKFNRLIEYNILKLVVKYNPDMEWKDSLDDQSKK